MKQKISNLSYLLSYAWSKTKKLFLTTGLKNLFLALLPLANVVGVGLVVDALTSGEKESITKIILFYVGFNLAVSILSSILTLFDNNVMREASDITQLDYMNDCVYLNYHYVQDRTVLNLKNKSMNAHPVWLLADLGKFLQYIVQFVGIFYLFSVLSPLFLLILILTSSVSVVLSFKRQKMDFELKNATVEENRKLDYLYTVMTDYKYAKEIRINNASDFIDQKYKTVLETQLEKFRVFIQKSTRMGVVSTVMTVIQTASMYLYLSDRLFEFIFIQFVHRLPCLLRTTRQRILHGFLNNRRAELCRLFDQFLIVKNLRNLTRHDISIPIAEHLDRMIL